MELGRTSKNLSRSLLLFPLLMHALMHAHMHTQISAPKTPTSRPKTPVRPFNPIPSSSDVCYFCNKKVYLMERMSANGLFFHRNCFRCSHCNCQLKIGGYSLSKGEGGEKGKFFCSVHYRQLFLSNPEAINYSRAGARKRDSQQEDMEVEENAREVVKPVRLVGAEGALTVPMNGIKILGDEKEEDEEVSGILGGLPPPHVDKEVAPKSPVSIIVRQPTVKAKKEQRGREEVEKMEVDKTPKEKEPVKLHTRPSPSRPVIGGGNVKRLSQGYEKLEATARGEDSTPVKQLGVVAEEEERGRGRLSSGSPRRSRSRSPSRWQGPGVKQSSMDEISPPPRSE